MLRSIQTLLFMLYLSLWQGDVKKSEIGIVWHTTYTGTSFEK